MTYKKRRIGLKALADVERNYQQKFDAEDRMRVVRRRIGALALDKPADCPSKDDEHQSENDVGLNEDDDETDQDGSGGSDDDNNNTVVDNDGGSTDDVDSSATLSMLSDDKAPQSVDDLLAALVRHRARLSDVIQNLYRHKNADGEFVHRDGWWVKIGPAEGNGPSNEVDKGYLDNN
ncbi:MAG: hypothetical protein Q9226_004396 [Calogaya cf. arnoldii]